MIDIFPIFLHKLEIYYQERFQKTKFTNQIGFFFANRVIYISRIN